MLALLVAVGAGLFWNKIAGSPSPLDGVSSLRRAEGLLFGRLPLPTEPTLLDPMTEMVAPKPAYKLMTIKHIPPVKLGTGMPHPYVGDCRHCHLTIGGAPAGSQYKTPVGAILESLSRVRKLGPPILPTSRQPHPPAGRCIKCHDIVVKVPLNGDSGVRWRL
ncbi:MAG: magnetochrome domain-containing protein [Alphaproteobacteria bacterium]|nr:magnetochrome domain-containing protein [Alphaproteobacteria bacterium]MBF0374563.1 magnetochrome domain-containing protein [Alphaproteobacteria bacterium]MBF0393662.1 magnetochrome domain-containing protein [Alphaproteobacteria bacterium]